MVLKYGVDPAYNSIKFHEKLTFPIGIYNIKGIPGAFGPKAMLGMGYATVTILIKENKYKIEMTDFLHQVAYCRDAFFARNGIVWDYEYAKVDFSDKNWALLRLEGLNKLYQILSDFSDYIRKNPKGDMDF